MRIRLPRTAPAAVALAVLVGVSACSGGQEPGPADEAGGQPTQTAASPSSAPPLRTPRTPGPYIASARWSDSDYGVTLKIAPSGAGRRSDGDRDAATAWREVLEITPDADTPGMWEQFLCHWTWARILEPDKATWNVEPWRPVVDDARMIAEGCNPGGPEV